jgi:antitoxin HigA-1
MAQMETCDMTNIVPVHPGEVLQELYMLPAGLTAGALARKLGVPRTRVERLINKETAISVDTALRLARFFNTAPQFWINMQTNFEVRSTAPEQLAEIKKITPLSVAA